MRSSLKGGQCCKNIESPPFPVISTPLRNNIFSLDNFSPNAVTALVTRTVEVICEEAWVPTCKGPERDVLFIVDASNVSDLMMR